MVKRVSGIDYNDFYRFIHIHKSPLFMHIFGIVKKLRFLICITVVSQRKAVTALDRLSVKEVNTMK